VPQRSPIKKAHVDLISGTTEFIAESTREMAMGSDTGLGRFGHCPLHLRDAATARKGLAGRTSIRH